ncbi:hypothetical protein GQ43DRAFT_66454 [Delitschia confertaspora ATCC 74209]|uniref:Uncharacterized protein n=1 Tax=Delitschia confertaspora ATCC 74209 TaxID=1513339 RepID=A0A9P4JNZ4_9PLEO|nr:hypothetical protein GQ43DRAFT_66454 [Delitschia confertaspora ATCC 74209]
MHYNESEIIIEMPIECQRPPLANHSYHFILNPHSFAVFRHPHVFFSSRKIYFPSLTAYPV